MVNWGQIREKGKQRFVLLYSSVLTILLVLDYYIIKFLLNSFRVEIVITEVFIVWSTSLFFGVTFTIYAWSRMEKDWHKNNPLFK